MIRRKHAPAIPSTTTRVQDRFGAWHRVVSVERRTVVVLVGGCETRSLPFADVAVAG